MSWNAKALKVLFTMTKWTIECGLFSSKEISGPFCTGSILSWYQAETDWGPKSKKLFYKL